MRHMPFGKGFVYGILPNADDGTDGKNRYRHPNHNSDFDGTLLTPTNTVSSEKLTCI